MLPDSSSIPQNLQKFSVLSPNLCKWALNMPWPVRNIVRILSCNLLILFFFELFNENIFQGIFVWRRNFFKKNLEINIERYNCNLYFNTTREQKFKNIIKSKEQENLNLPLPFFNIKFHCIVPSSFFLELFF